MPTEVGLGAPSTHAHRRKAKKATGVAVFGTFIEYYDFSVYGYVAATLSVVFFPSDDPTTGLLNTLLVFGSAFFVRPLGALFFGWLGDRKGRRFGLIASVTVMGVAATLTGLLPGYAQLGAWAPVLLVVFRMLQGFSAGGEVGGASSYIREWAEPRRRSVYLSLIPATAQLGKGAAAGMAAIVAAALPAPAMESWGWRIPFLLALPLGALCLYLRLRVEDSPEFVENSRRRGTTAQPVRELFSEHRKPLAKVFAIALVQNTGTYIGTVFVAVYFSNILGFSKGAASAIVLVAVLLAGALIPVAGQLAARSGAKRMLLWSYCAYIVLTVPSFFLMNQGSVALAMAGLALVMVPYALCQAGTSASIPEFFPVQVRNTGVAFGHSLGAAFGGGGAPYLAAWLIGISGNTFVPAFILILAGALGLAVVALTVRETSGSSAHLYR
ncbi:MFS transporter [Saccharopolyspora sp. NPDC050389]|uniref:MFS transporter n=1 Tax=Saccharopolyspora sp. NPDC050389 TaxID=3155516 RepID=UPI0034116697